MTLSIATWNVNSVRTRLPHLLDFLRKDAPDIVLLQELKCTDDAFPRMEIEDLGYNIALYGEKTYNGVAILSKFPLDDVRRGLPGDDGDLHARYIEAVVSLPRNPMSDAGKQMSNNIDIRHLASGISPQAMRVASVYVPNGQETGSDKFTYKLKFLERLQRHAAELLRYDEILAIGGDYNVAPYAVDVHDAKTWEPSVLFCAPARDALRRMLNMGMVDAFRLANPLSPSLTLPPAGGGDYTWWDYRANALAANDGLRIDHILLSPQAADRLAACTIEKDWRALEKPSDHAPVLAKFSI